MKIRVYTSKMCQNCKKVKEFLAADGEAYEEVNITTAEALTELRMNGVFTLDTPVVQVGSTFITPHELFDGDELRKERVKGVIKKEASKKYEKEHS